MFIKSIVLDGFKSYGTRTEISGFDREFNAITGLNGSGKSNILDAICFLLGLQTLSQVRALTLQDLVYKQGQTGVSKASVTITFDNNDKTRSPINYEKHNEIVITRQAVLGGSNKYLVNGANATNIAVKDLFGSVQLNVNNPHFLVMQGRITKVLNMKPMEIMSMIEEAAGTGMFEAKKLKSERELDRKEQRRLEINHILNTEVTPTLDKLKQERGQFLEFKQVERELIHSRKVYIAWKYYSSKEMSEKGKEKAEEIIQNINEKRATIAEGEQNVKQIDSKIAEFQRQMDNDSGGSLAQAEAQLKTDQTQYNHHVGGLKQNQESIEDEKKRIVELEQSVKDDEKVLKVKSAALDKIEGTFHRLAEAEESDKKQLDAARNKYQAISAGMEVDEDGNEGTLQDRLMAAQRAVADAKLQMETIKRKKPHAEGELSAKTKEMNKLDAELRKDNAVRDQLEKQVANLRSQLDAIDALKEEERSVNMEASKLRRQRDSFEQRDGRLSFRYQDPESGFSKKSVHGLICRLIEVDNPEFSLAIEKTAGGRLFNVVVDTDVTSKKLLNNGKLERRTTIIPLNKISGRRLNGRVVDAAKRVAGANNVWSALSLIKYSDVLQPAMDYIFGTTLICRDIATAKKVCYHPEVKARCVTLDGDVCDPSGTLSGGAADRSQPILPMLQELRVLLRQLDTKDIRLAEIDRELKQISGNPQAVKAKLDQLQDELCSVAARLQQSDQIKQEVQLLKTQVSEFAQRLVECEEIIKKETATVAEVQGKIGKTNRESMLKAAESDVKKLTSKAALSRKEVLKRKDEYEALKLELSELNSQIRSHIEQIEKHVKNIAALESEKVELTHKVAEAKAAMDEVKSELKSVKDIISQKSKEMQKMQSDRDKIRKKITNYELEIKQDEKDHDKWKQEAKECKQRVADLYKEHDWISEEEQYFNTPKGAYDFSQTDPNEAGKRVAQLTERKNKLERTLNTKAMALLDKTQARYDLLLTQREQVDRDKIKILKVIHELSERKKEALVEAYMQVNKDFSSIFSTLLPGSQAKLKPVDDKNVLKGFEFRVGFGKGTWKESLTELSGGQRSLVALSLILAMLLFKPAPLYILDEVDAALDLSHTNNIGNMLKTHFKASQFIVVSLKDGMFNNANVLFRTKFVDGMSTISRTVNNLSCRSPPNRGV